MLEPAMQTAALRDLLRNCPENAQLDVAVVTDYLDKLTAHLSRYWGLSSAERYLVGQRLPEEDTLDKDLEGAFVALYQNPLWRTPAETEG